MFRNKYLRKWCSFFYPDFIMLIKFSYQLNNIFDVIFGFTGLYISASFPR